jgi:hypothetical protein
VAVSVFITSSAASALKPRSAAASSMAPPLGTFASPGVTDTVNTGAAAASDHGMKITLAASLRIGGPMTRSSAAAAAAPPSIAAARPSRERSNPGPASMRRTSARACSITRADKPGDGRSAGDTPSSCTALSRVCLSSGACSST